MSTAILAARAGRTCQRAGVAAGLATVLGITLPGVPPPASAGPVRAHPVPARAVELTTMGDEYRRVFAQPDGTYRLEQSLLPVRVRRGTGWVPVDTTLRRAADGTVVPGATVVGLSFSGGGTGALATLRRDGRSLALSWPGPLPQPVLSGDTATYPELLPGVDLRVRADAEGFTHVLVVKHAVAAANPALARLRFATTTEGLTVRKADDGSLAAVDAAGQAVFQAPAPIMWDSPAPVGTRSADSDVRPMGQVRPMRTEVAAGELSLIPDQELLTGGGANFPVMLDPAWTGARQARTQVWSNYPSTGFFNGGSMGGNEEMRVGYDATDRKRVRSFFQFDIAGVRGKNILKATLLTTETYSRSCTPTPVEVWVTGPISARTAWNRQPTWQVKLDSRNVARGYRPTPDSCKRGGVDFGTTNMVVDALKRGASNITLGLKATARQESTQTLSWKKFTNNPSLSIVYNTIPGAPSNLSTDGVAGCAAGADRPTIGNAVPALRATVSDVDNSVFARFQWSRQGAATPLGEHVSEIVGGKVPTVLRARIPAGAFADGDVGQWRVRAEDGADVSAWSPWCEFRVDTTMPPPPTAGSAAFPDGGTGNAVIGTPVTVTFGANGADDIVAYEHGLNVDSTQLSNRATPAAPGGSVDVNVIPDRFVNWLHVRAVDPAGNRSETVTFMFYALAPSGPVAAWAMDETGNGTVAEDTTGRGFNAAVVGAADWSDGVTGGALTLDGRTQHARATAPVLDTSRSFAVSAWARLSSKAKAATVVAVDGTHRSAFDLRYEPGVDRWRLVLTRADAGVSDQVAVSSPVPAQVGVWTHLTGVYDASARQIRIYVNGTGAEPVAVPGSWRANGPLQIGRSKTVDTYANYFTGDLDAVQAYDRILMPGEIQQVAREAGRWKLDETAGSTAGDATGAHPATFSPTGVSRVVGQTGNAVALDGTTGVVSTTGPVVRTDGSFTVAAWLRPAAITANAVAVSQGGVTVSGFTLGYAFSAVAGGYRWSVRAPAADAATAQVPEAVALLDAPATGAWAYVAAVYDARAHRLRIYVNGQYAGSSFHAASWNAAGSLTIGRGRLPGTTAPSHWPGAVDDVRVTAGVLDDQEIQQLYTQATT